MFTWVQGGGVGRVAVSSSTGILLLPAEGLCGGTLPEGGDGVGEGREGKRTSEIKARWFLGSSFRQEEKRTRTGAWEWSQGPELEGPPLGAPPLSFVQGPQPVREVNCQPHPLYPGELGCTV